MECDVAHFEVFHLPERLVGIGKLHVLKGETVHLAEEFWRIDYGVAHDHIVAVPDSRSRANLEIAVGDERTIDVPPRVFSDEAAAVCLEALAAFDSAFALSDGDVFESRVVDGEERSLASKCLVFDELHNCLYIIVRFSIFNLVLWYFDTLVLYIFNVSFADFCHDSAIQASLTALAAPKVPIFIHRPHLSLIRKMSPLNVSSIAMPSHTPCRP